MKDFKVEIPKGAVITRPILRSVACLHLIGRNPISRRQSHTEIVKVEIEWSQSQTLQEYGRNVPSRLGPALDCDIEECLFNLLFSLGTGWVRTRDNHDPKERAEHRTGPMS